MHLLTILQPTQNASNMWASDGGLYVGGVSNHRIIAPGGMDVDCVLNF